MGKGISPVIASIILVLVFLSLASAYAVSSFQDKAVKLRFILVLI